MKGDKKILALAILVLLITVCFGSYAIYRSSANGTGTVNAAAWQVEINGTDMDSASFTFDYEDITWTTRTGYNNTIAPGSVGTITIPVNATGSEVDVLISATLGQATLPTGMTVSVHGDADQTIQYSASDMTANVVLDVEWSGSDSDTTSKDTSDLAVEGEELSIPVTLTAKQSVANH